jgi:hypothetical protein
MQNQLIILSSIEEFSELIHNSLFCNKLIIRCNFFAPLWTVNRLPLVPEQLIVMNSTSQLHRRAVAINRIYCRTFAVPGQKGEKVPKGGKAGKKDSTGERKLLDNMYLLATASEKAKK